MSDGSQQAVSVSTFYLEMLDRGALRPRQAPLSGAAVARVSRPCPALNRFFYTAIGGDWYWIDRLNWTERQWRKYLDRPELETHVVTVEGAPAGYFELERQAGQMVEIAYFGLLPEWAGSGLGGFALTRAVEQAWSRETSRVWVHTCSLDHPAALQNYLARGFHLYQTTVEEKVLPAVAPGPWPRAR